MNINSLFQYYNIQKMWKTPNVNILLDSHIRKGGEVWYIFLSSFILLYKLYLFKDFINVGLHTINHLPEVKDENNTYNWRSDAKSFKYINCQNLHNKLLEKFNQ